MLLFIVPPFVLLVPLLAYLFQERAASLRLDMDQPDDGPAVRIVRATLHGLTVFLAGVYSLYGGGALLAASLFAIGRAKAVPISGMERYFLLSVFAFFPLRSSRSTKSSTRSLPFLLAARVHGMRDFCALGT